jgi:hypothetical protein
MTRGFNAANNSWPLLMPRKCYVFVGTLENKTLWPYRIEWWGPVLIRGDDVLLLEMEFREPRIVKADSNQAKAFLQECTFSPGAAKVTDRTRERIDGIKQIRMFQQQQQMAPQGAAPQPPANK